MSNHGNLPDSETMNFASVKSSPQDTSSETGISKAPRRHFIKGVFAIGSICAALCPPIAAGAMVFLDPLFKKRGSKSKSSSVNDQAESTVGYFRVATTDSLVENHPQLFKVYADRVDAWNQFNNQAIGGVFLQKQPDGGIIAWNSRCPHLGCSVETKHDGEGFLCPCHMGMFDPLGIRQNQISPRDLDRLEVEVRGEEVWVQFKNYRQGISDKVELS